MNDITFTRQLIKGKITEIIFQKVFESSRMFTVIPMGYESTNPIVRQYNYIPEINKMLKNISDSPDFALISKDENTIMLVEVKYRKSITPSSLKSLAKKISNQWNDAYVFLMTQEGMYLGKCSDVIETGVIQELSEEICSKRKQKSFLKLLQEYIHVDLV